MPVELKQVSQFQLGSTRKPKWEVKDLNGATSFSVNRATWSLKDEDGVEFLSGSCSVNNADEDAAGNEIKTIQPTIEFVATDLVAGYYNLSFRVYLDNGEDDTFKVTVEIVDYN